ncbi:PEPxxWA-CTERM sorting domain-containing protein [Phenylobacterium sp.]|uniref:PEPxxWA-CTERM sorting domain-containing protein n=1 Tax=Phenylobacterium sp. TaxID=1871053 RepID=UPI00301D7497
MKRFPLAAAAALALAASTLAVPAGAAVVTLKFEGNIPSTNAFFGSGLENRMAPGQISYIEGIQLGRGATPGSAYEFVFEYDTEAAITGASRYPLTFVSGFVGSNTDFSGFTPYIQFRQVGEYAYMNLILEKLDTIGPNTYRTYAAFSVGDRGGDVTLNLLPESLDPTSLDFIVASFETFGREGAYRHIVDGVSRGLSVVPQGAPGGVGAIPEPGAWAMMILGFGAVGALLRRRRPRIGAFAA